MTVTIISAVVGLLTALIGLFSKSNDASQVAATEKVENDNAALRSKLRQQQLDLVSEHLHKVQAQTLGLESKKADGSTVLDIAAAFHK